MLEKKELSKVRLAYGLGDFYGGASVGVISLLFMFFLTDMVHLSGLQAGVVLFVGRFVDAVIDPFLGSFSDRLKLPSGRRVPFFLAGVLPVMASFVLIWLAPGFNSVIAKVCYYTVVYSFFSIAYSMVMIPYGALAPELTPDTAQRNSIVGVRMACSIIGGLIAAVLPTVIIGLFAQNVMRGYLVMSLSFAVVFGLIWLMMFFVMRGREICPSEDAQTGFFESVRQAFRNRAFNILVAIYLLAFIPNDITGANFKYFLTYYLGRPNDFSLVVGLTMVSAVLSLPLYLWFMKRIGKPRTMLWGCLFRSLTLLGYFVVRPTSSMGLILVLAALNGIGMGSSYAVPWAMLPDVTDYDEAVSGTRNEGMYTGLMSFIRQLSSSVAMLTLGLILELSHYVGDAVTQVPSAVTAIRLTTILLPLILSLLAAWSAARFPVTPSRFGKIREVIELRRSGAFAQLPEEEQRLLTGEILK